MALAIFSSCSDDDGLDNRLDKVEDALGTDEPLKVTFSTTNYDDVTIASNRTYLLKSSGTNEYIWDNLDGTYEIYIERFSDVEWYEGAWIEFTYNPETREVTNDEAGTYFYDQFGSYHNARFYENQDANAVEIEVNSFNAETGKISVNVTANSEEAYGNNIYEGNPMTMTLRFRGNLRVFQSSGD
jgi:hypothetical protein